MKYPRIIAAAFTGIWMSAAIPSIANAKEIITVYKNQLCECCQVWVTRLRSAGYNVQTIDVEDLSEIKKQANVPAKLHACHTAVYRNYVLEGHIPIEAIEKLDREQPAVFGIAVAGMPNGALGMDYDPTARYDVMAYSNIDGDPISIFYEVGK